MASQSAVNLHSAVIHAVILLEDYRGERIVAGEHPIHKAIVAIEALCKQRAVNAAVSVKQSHVLPGAIAYIWYSLLDVSRSTRLPSRRCWYGWWRIQFYEQLPRKRKRRALLLAAALAAALTGMAEMVWWYSEAKGRLPFRRKRVQVTKEMKNEY